jgi:hypothetical protein
MKFVEDDDRGYVPPQMPQKPPKTPPKKES